MQLRRALGISALLALTLVRPALGQKMLALGIGGGAVIPVGKLSDTQIAGYNAILGLAIGVSELPIGLRFDGIYNNFSHKNVSGVSTYDLRVIGALGNLIFAFPGTSAKPYIIVGGGLYNTKSSVPGAKSENKFGFNAGIGATFGVGPFATFLESRYHSISRNAADGGVMQFVPITVGLMF
jgi:outer membrane protein with beta-barrel domain